MASWQSVSGCESGCFDYYAAAEALVTEMAVYFSEKGWVAKRPTWSFILLLRNTFCYFCRNNIFLVLYWYLLFFLSLFNTCILIIKTRKNTQHNLIKSVTQHDCHLPRSQYHNCGLGWQKFNPSIWWFAPFEFCQPSSSWTGMYRTEYSRPRQRQTCQPF